jgi:hypothetical protein
MSLDSWWKRRQRRELDLDSGEFVSLNLSERPKPSGDYRPTYTVAQSAARQQSIVHRAGGPWNRRYALFSIALIPLVISLLAPDSTRDIAKRLSHTVQQLPPRDQGRIMGVF